MPGEKILVVDDEPANLQKLRRTFVHRYEVLAAASGEEALELARRHDDIAVIVADQRMPGISGVEFLRRTLELLPHAVRIILTGYTDVDALMEAINTCKVYRYIVKPWDPPDLLMTVERGLEAHRLAVENERFRKELVRRERLARELEIARDIQRSILPPECPQVEGYAVAVAYHPAREVGGDLYDFHWDPASGKLQIVIGDASGKSVPAALYAAVFSGQIRSLLAQSTPPAEVLGFLNRSLLARRQGGNYIAAACLCVDVPQGSMLVANAGMPFPYLARGGTLARIPVAGVPLGLMEEAIYQEAEERLEKGDTLLLVSDGVLDAVNPDGEAYDPGRVERAILDHVAGELPSCVQRIHHAVLEFVGDAEVPDDMTIIGLRRLA